METVIKVSDVQCVMLLGLLCDKTYRLEGELASLRRRPHIGIGRIRQLEDELGNAQILLESVREAISEL